VNQIKSAIDGANGLLNQLNANLTSIDNQIATAKVNGLALTQNLSIALNNKDGIQQQINITQTDINNINSNIGTQSKSCDQATQIISNLQLNVSNLQGSLIGLDQKVANIDSQIVNYNKQIDDLKKQIA
jgi:chromosome segregation ATPase